MRLFALVLCVALAGCATQSTAPAQYYRAPGQNNQISISGTLKQKPGFFSRDMANDVLIIINGQSVASGNFTGGSVELSGSFDGKPVAADCSAISSGAYGWGGMNPTNVKCLVFIDGDRAANLLLVP